MISSSTAKSSEGESYDGPTTMERLQTLHDGMNQVLRELDELRRAGRMYYQERGGTDGIAHPLPAED